MKSEVTITGFIGRLHCPKIPSFLLRNLSAGKGLKNRIKGRFLTAIDKPAAKFQIKFIP
jgi:hypothetical protein